jgi:hypothetical protein
VHTNFFEESRGEGPERGVVVHNEYPCHISIIAAR